MHLEPVSFIVQLFFPLWLCSKMQKETNHHCYLPTDFQRFHKESPNSLYKRWIRVIKFLYLNKLFKQCTPWISSALPTIQSIFSYYCAHAAEQPVLNSTKLTRETGSYSLVSPEPLPAPQTVLVEFSRGTKSRERRFSTWALKQGWLKHIRDTKNLVFHLWGWVLASAIGVVPEEPCLTEGMAHGQDGPSHICKGNQDTSSGEAPYSGDSNL